MNKYLQSNISARQLTIMTVFFTIGSGILIVPSSVASLAKRDAWIACLVGLAIGIAILCIYNLLTKLYPKLNLVQMMEAIFGRWLGKAIAILVVVTLFLTGPATALYYTGNFVTTQIMPETPPQAINILFIVVIIMGVKLGLETIARSSELMFSPFMILFISFVILVLNQTQTKNILPIMENGMKPIWPAAMGFMATVLLPQFILLIFHSSSVEEPKQARRALLIGSTIGGLSTTIIVTLTILVFGSDVIATSMYPSYLLAQKINIGDFLQRIEVIMAIMWYTTLFFRVAIYLYFTAISLTYILNLRDYRSLVMPLGMILVGVSEITYPNVTFMQSWDSTTWVSYTVVLSVFLPIIMLFTHMFRNLVPNDANASSNASGSSGSSNSQNTTSSSDSSGSSGSPNPQNSQNSSSSPGSSDSSNSQNSSSSPGSSDSSGSSGSSNSLNSSSSSDSSGSSSSSSSSSNSS